MSTAFLFVWFFIQAEMENVGVKNHNEKAVKEMKVMMESYENLTKSKNESDTHTSEREKESMSKDDGKKEETKDNIIDSEVKEETEYEKNRDMNSKK